MLDDRGGLCGGTCTTEATRDTATCQGPPPGAPSYELSCFVCHGRDPDCVECHGENRIPIDGCPRARITPEHEAAIVALVQLERGILPAPGAWLDQAATFVAAFPLLTTELEHWRQVARDRAAKKG